MNSELAATLFREFRKLPICDPHTHVPWDKPAATHLGDLLGYHYYTELANSSRGTPVTLPDCPKARIEYVWPHIPQLRGTVQWDWMMGISEIFLGIPRADWKTQSREQITARAQKVIEAPGYSKLVFDRSNVTHVYLTNQFDEDLSKLRDPKLVPCLRTDDLVFNIVTNKAVDRLNKTFGGDVGSSLTSFENALKSIFDRFASWKFGYAALGLPGSFEYREVSSEIAERLLKKAARGEPLNKEELHDWARFMLDRLATHCRRVGAPFMLMCGPDRGVYQQGVPAGQDLFRCDAHLRGYDAFFNKYPDVRFPLMIVSDSGGLELVTQGWIRHNVYPTSHWWYSNNPVDIRRELRRRLDVLPRNKFIGFHSDGYSLEFTLPKFNTFRLQLALTLAERIEESRIAPSDTLEPLDVNGAMDIAEKILNTNPREILGIKK